MWLGLAPVPLLPSPKFHAYVYGEVPPVAVPVKATAAGTSPAVGPAAAVTTSGGGGEVTVIAGALAVAVWEALSVTVSLAV